MISKIKNISIKQVMYFCVVLALNWVQFVRATQYESLIAPAVIASGLLVLVIVFTQIPIKRILNPFSYIYSFVCLAAIVSLVIFRFKLPAKHLLYSYSFIILNVWMIGLAVGYILSYGIKNGGVRFKLGPCSILWFAFTVITVIGVSNKWWPLWFFLVFGLYYVIPFKKEDLKALFDAVIDGTIVSFFIIQICAFIFRPYDTVRYSGLFVNCNDTALYYLIVYAIILAKLYLLHEYKAKIGWKIFYFAGAGALLSFQFLTLTRTAWVASIVLTIVYGIIVVMMKWKNSILKALLWGVILVSCFIATFPPVFLCVRYLPTIHPHPVWFQGEYSEEKVHSWDSRDSEKYTDIDEFLDEALGRFGAIIGLAESKIGLTSDSMAVESQTRQIVIPVENDEVLNDSIKIRKLIFKTYLENSTWLGRDSSKCQFYLGDESIEIYHSQNLWIQMIFEFGYIAGAVVAVLSVWIIIKRFRYAIKSDNPYNILALLLTLVFFIYGLTEVVWIPGYIVMPYFFLMQKKLD